MMKSTASFVLVGKGRISLTCSGHSMLLPTSGRPLQARPRRKPFSLLRHLRTVCLAQKVGFVISNTAKDQFDSNFLAVVDLGGSVTAFNLALSKRQHEIIILFLLPLAQT